MLLGVLVVASGEETQLVGAGGSAWRKYMFRRHQDQPSVPVSPGHSGLTVAGRQQQAEGWLGQKGLLCSMPSVVPRGTRPGPMAVSWPVASLGATRTSPTLLAVSVPDASAVSAVSRAVGWGVGQGGARNGRCWWS